MSSRLSRKMELEVAISAESKPIMMGSPVQRESIYPHHNKWLVLIAAYKLLGALLFVAIGVGAFRLVGQDIDDVLTHIASDLHFNPEWRFVNFVLDKISLLDDPMLRRIGLGAFCYAGLGVLEAAGLYLEKAWGEYLTVIITASFLPLEIHELIRRLTSVRVGLFVANLFVLGYLVKLLAERTTHRRRAARPVEGQS